MLGDIIRILADEPEKIEKAVLRGIKLILNILIAAHLHKLIVGPFSLIPIGNYEELARFLLSGRVLICLLFYFASEYFITPLIHALAYGAAFLFSHIKVEISNSDFRQLLKWCGIVHYGNADEIPLPGKNIDLLYKLALPFSDEGARDQIDLLKDTYIGNVLYAYSVFFLAYFFIIGTELRTAGLNAIVILGLFLSLFFYAMIHRILEYFLKHSQEITKGLSFIKINGVVTSVLSENGIVAEWGDGSSGTHKCKVFQVGKKECVLLPTLDARNFNANDIEKFIGKRRQENRVFVLIAEKNVQKNWEELSSKYSTELIVVEYLNEEELRKKLKSKLDILEAEAENGHIH